MSDINTEKFVEEVVTKAMLLLKAEIGFIPEFNNYVRSDFCELVARCFIGENTVEEAVDFLYKEVLTVVGYKPEGRWYRKDPDGSQMTSFGFVIAPDGCMYHLTEQYCHGAVMAALEPIQALKCGYIHPTKNLWIGVHNYQDFELSKGGKELNYIRFGCSWYNRVSGDLSKCTPEQYKTLKNYFKNFDVVNEKVTTDRVIYSTGQDLLKDVDRMLYDVKMGVKDVKQDEKLCELYEPKEDFED